jgi:hypothetical protein
MTKKNGRNDPCECGSGKKYKKCCMLAVKSSDIDKPKNLQAFASIDSTGDSSASMEIFRTSMTKDGITEVLLDEKMTLSTNTIPGDKTNDASALLSLPYNGHTKPEIRTFGNSSVTNDKLPFDIGIANNSKSLKIHSKNGLFAKVLIEVQRDLNFNYLSIIFGVTGGKEFINKSGRKNRSHLAFYSNGTGKFIRLADDKGDIDQTWIIENVKNYNTKDKNIIPSKITISSKKFTEKLILNFIFNPDVSKVVLSDGIFQ